MAKVTRKKMARGVELTVDQVFDPMNDMDVQLSTSNVEAEQMEKGEGIFRLNFNIPWLGSKYFFDNRTSGLAIALQGAGNGYMVGGNVGTTGGSGSGLTVDIVKVVGGGLGPGPIETVRIARHGSGYLEGETVDVLGGAPLPLATLRLSVVPDTFDGPFYIPFCLPPLQENFLGTDASPVLGPDAPFPVLKEVSFSLDQSDEPAAVLDHWYGRDKYQYDPAFTWMPNPHGGKKTYNRTDAYEFTLSIFEKEQVFFNSSTQETDPFQVGGEAVSITIPASAFISRTTRFNPISVGDINRQLHPLKTYCLAIFAPNLHDISLGREHCTANNIWVSLKFQMPLTDRDTDVAGLPNLVQNLPQHLGTRTGPNIPIVQPAAGDLVIADGQDGVGAETGISTNMQLLDEQFSSKLRGGYNEFAQVYPTQTVKDDAAYEIMAVPLGGGFPHNRMSARDEYPLAPYVSGHAFGAIPPAAYEENPYVDRRLIPIDGDMTIHHVIVALNWTSDSIQDAYDPVTTGLVEYGPAFVPGTAGTVGKAKYSMGVAMVTGPRADLFEYQQIAFSEFTPGLFTALPDGLIDAVRMGLPACSRMPFEWELISIPIRHQVAIPSPDNGRGYWGFSGGVGGTWDKGEQGTPWFVGEGNTYTSNRTSVGLAPGITQPFHGTFINPENEGVEQFLEVRLSVDPQSTVYGSVPPVLTWAGSYQQGDIFLGYGGCWVYIIGKKHLK